MKITEIKIEYVEQVPDNINEGILYISEKYNTAIHLCACGCGAETVTPLSAGEWTLTKINDSVTLRPSIGNFKGQNHYHAHYYITDSKIQWL